MSAWITATATGVSLRLVVQPRASRTQVVGEHGDALKIRLAAPPVDGAANEALIEFLAKTLSVPRSAVAVRSGQAGRRKLVAVDGVTANAVLERLCG